MATRAPYRADTRTYKGTTFAFSFTIKEDSSALDLTTLDKVQIKMFNDAGEVFDYDTNGNLSISGASNETVSGTADPTTMDIAIREYYVELWLHYSDGTDDVYAVLHNNIIEAKSSQSEGAHDFEIDIDTSAETVSGQPIAVLAEAVDAKEDTKAIRDSLAFKGVYDNTTAYKKENRVSYQGRAYIALQDTTGNTPTGSDTDNAFWAYIAGTPLATSFDETDDTKAVSGKIADEGIDARRVEDDAFAFNQHIIDTTGTTELPPATSLLPTRPDLENLNISLTRNTSGIRWNELGLAERISTDTMRYNFNPNTGIYEGRVIQEQWTNEILDPRDMTTANWNTVNGLSVAKDATGIDGSQNTACTLTPSVSNSRVYWDTTITDDSSTHVGGVFVKKKTSSQVMRLELFCLDGTTVEQTSNIDLSDGTLVSGNGNVEDKGDWWFIWDDITNNGSGNTRFRLRITPDNSGSNPAVIDVAEQFLNGSTPPPTPVYGTTAGQAFTQDPDLASITLSDVNLNEDDNTFTFEFTTGYGAGTLFDIYSDANNRMYVERNASNEIHFIIVDGGTTQADLNLGTVADNTNGKIAVGWVENDIAGCLDGGTVQTDSSATIPTVTDINFGRDYNDANYWNAFISKGLSHQRKLSSSNIQNLT